VERQTAFIETSRPIETGNLRTLTSWRTKPDIAELRPQEVVAVPFKTGAILTPTIPTVAREGCSGRGTEVPKYHSQEFRRMRCRACRAVNDAADRSHLDVRFFLGRLMHGSFSPIVTVAGAGSLGS